MKHWIQTVSGVRFDLIEPEPPMVKITDIAFALSILPRFTGHAGQYSIAQHSVLVSRHCPYPKEGLLHDAAEAYVNDLSRPVKEMLRFFEGKARSSYDMLEDLVMEAIAIRFDLKHLDGDAEALHVLAAVRLADLRALSTERRDLFGDDKTRDWTHIPDNGYHPFEVSVLPVWEPERAREEFLRRFLEVC